jgi:hypothetical protein
LQAKKDIENAKHEEELKRLAKETPKKPNGVVRLFTAYSS